MTRIARHDNGQMGTLRFRRRVEPDTVIAMFKDRAILTLAISQTLIWAGIFYIFPASLLRWEAALGWQRADLTLGITMAVLASALGSPIAGRIIDAGHGPKMIGITSVIGGAAVVALSQMTTLGQFYALWLVIGFAMAGCLYDPVFSLLTHARGANAKRSIVTITLVAGFAGTVSFPAVHVLAEAYGWRIATAVIGGTVVVLVSPMQYLAAQAIQRARVVPPPEPAGAPHPKNFLRRPAFWLLGLALACLALTHGATLHHLLPMLNERDLPLDFAVLIAAMIGPMQVAGRIVMVASQRFLTDHQFMLIAFGLMSLSLVLLMISGDTRVLILAFVMLFGGGWGTVSILRPLITREILGERNFGAKFGSLSLLFLSAASISAYFGAVIWTLGGYALMLGVLILMALMGAIFYVMAHKFSAKI